MVRRVSRNSEQTLEVKVTPRPTSWDRSRLNIELEGQPWLTVHRRGDQHISDVVRELDSHWQPVVNRQELKLIFVRPRMSLRTVSRSQSPFWTLMCRGLGVSGPRYVSRRGTNPDVHRKADVWLRIRAVPPVFPRSAWESGCCVRAEPH